MITSDGRYTYTYNDESGIATCTSVANGEVHEYAGWLGNGRFNVMYDVAPLN